MILQTDLVIAVRVITTVRPGETLEQVNDRLQTITQDTFERMSMTAEGARCSVVDHSAGGVSSTTTVVQE